MTAYTPFDDADAARHIAVPRDDDDKYSRGVLGVITGSEQYPGAAVIGVDAALHTGVGMVRYLGSDRPSTLVLQRRPEAVATNGRVQAWLIGSGMDAVDREPGAAARMDSAVAESVPVVLDGGALDLHARTSGPTVITPHYRELARVLGVDAAAVAADPGEAAHGAALTLGVTVLLKGHTSHIAAPDGTRLSVAAAPSWLATAGAGDALGGILGALVATNSSAVVTDPGLLARLAATAALLHGRAAARASGGGPLTVLGLIAELPGTIAGLIAR
ncbi:ADP-dependent NAD(P)H-hydrate dehydratase [Galbitalea soli]|uniref:ADP-dependent (S)-NAD(P)H-hydrate dehydratase n=1 Tax=Galbitalea soli TaxID=1268042 RepID=A0A7C9PLW0_9MICO|nr:ADP/ATP-dependent (S)-NAD(P)H-hydrate dehydratase [Galbitalea soli]NEM90510.1 NAD(P)H-hydrate dehydratase [Galbitalea soli]NYJ31223.1 NAD(P)H-hydrate repair Nnr-like enzyme with NAD(P)H-hydrate dehydratase domain [Galbitalea soli]